MLVSEGTLTFTIPYYLDLSGNTIQKQQGYLNDLEYEPYTGNTNIVTEYYVSIGQSRVNELKKYGTNEYIGITTNNNITGYTIDNLHYQDYPEGYTIISGYTGDYTKEEIYSRILTRNEHFLGFFDEPKIYSDIYIERKRQNISESNLKICEINNIGELITYNNKYFKIINQ